MNKTLIYKITFENTDNGKSYYYFVSALEGEFGVLSSPHFESKITEAKTNETYCIKDKILDALKDD